MFAELCPAACTPDLDHKLRPRRMKLLLWNSTHPPPGVGAGHRYRVKEVLFPEIASQPPLPSLPWVRSTGEGFEPIMPTL